MRDLYPLVHDARLRHLLTWGLVRPAARTKVDTYFTLADMAVIKQVNDGLRQGLSFRGIVRRQLAARAGQLTFNFNARGDARPAKVVALRRRASRKFAPRDDQPPWTDSDNPQSAIAARFFLEGAELDEGSEGRARAGPGGVPQGAGCSIPRSCPPSSTWPTSTTRTTSWSRRRRCTPGR